MAQIYKKTKKRANRKKNNKKDKDTHTIEFSQKQSRCGSNRQKMDK